MAVSLRGYAQTFSSTASTNITIPVSVQAGDLLILQAVGGLAPTIPAGWASEYANTGTNIGSFVATKTAIAGDASATVTVNWSGGFNNVVNIAAVAGGSGLRSPAAHLWASSGGTGTPTGQTAAANDLILYMGGNRQDGGAPTLSRGTVAVAAADGSTVAAGVIGYELTATDIVGLTCTFTAPSSGLGYEYSTLVISGGSVLPTASIMSRDSAIIVSSDTTTARIVSRESAVILTNDSATKRTLSRDAATLLTNDSVIKRTASRVSVQVLIPTAKRFRGWGTSL
ncbi:MAG: hypothetical protein ABIR37_04125 [Candidatus Saccharimonadales bacterium]